MTGEPLAKEDYYFENGRMVLTAVYLKKRGYCCGNGCRHCPYDYVNCPEKRKNENQARVHSD